MELQNIAEEIEALGREQSSQLQSAYRLIAMHLLKLKYQSTIATKSWRRTVPRERFNIKTIIDNNPGLKPRQQELFAKSYADARKEASIETGLPIETFPIDPVFIRDQVEDIDFLP